jgi:hypothetical protein
MGAIGDAYDFLIGPNAGHAVEIRRSLEITPGKSPSRQTNTNRMAAQRQRPLKTPAASF